MPMFKSASTYMEGSTAAPPPQPPPTFDGKLPTPLRPGDSKVAFFGTSVVEKLPGAEKAQARFSFEAPSSPGEFVVLAIGTSPSRFGSVNTTLLVRKGLTLRAQVPLIVRGGDHFTAGSHALSVHDVTLTLKL